jgi:hypothetical protein
MAYSYPTIGRVYTGTSGRERNPLHDPQKDCLLQQTIIFSMVLGSLVRRIRKMNRKFFD